jgi:hypothetical protein
MVIGEHPLFSHAAMMHKEPNPASGRSVRERDTYN